MALSSGARVGPYEVVSEVGAGGMGEVYRAHDPRLGRDVAIKVLPSGFSADPERLQRFEQEARSAAALNHPNILAVHDIGQHDGAPYIVSELLEGETVRERLNAGAIPVRKAVEYAIQIAHGLAAAHEKGIVHRDLKPENLFITADGRAKILDFGLAKLTQVEPALAGLSALPTTPPNTTPGVVLGTIGYMSPEQVRGLQADHRSDIFAFGAVLYEMLAGQRAFRGDTTVDTMSAILKEDPPGFPAAERQIPPALERVVDRCLEKNTARRFQSTHDLAFALEGLSAQSGAAPAAVGASTRRAAHLTGERVAWLAALIATGLVTGALVFFVTQPRVEPAAAVRFEVLPPPETTVDAGPAAPQPALSPDGRRLAFQVVNAEDQTVLAVRSFDTRESQVLPGTEGALLPFWSPDNRFIGFFAQGKLKKIDVTGGPPQVVCDAEVGEGGTWNRDGTIVFAPNMGTGLVRVSAAGGTPVPVTMLDEAKQELSHYHPWFLPDGRHFLFVARGPGNPPAQTIYAGSLDSLERTELVATNSKALYADGHLLFVREGTLLAQPFDSISLKVTGESFPATEDVGFNVIQARAAVSASATGTIAYRAAAAGELSQLVWFDRTGRQVATVGDPVDQMNVELSPDDTRVAVSVLDLATITRDLAIYDLARGGFRTRFTFDPEDEYFGIWSPDGSQVAFSSLRKGRIHTYQKAASGGVAENVVLADARENTYPSSWSADGRFIFYHTGNAKSPTLSDIWALPLAGGRKPVSVVQTALSEGGAQISPDGRWVAYRSNVSGGRTEVFVVPFRVPGQLSSTAASPRSTRQVSTAGGTNPRWRGDGQELFYLSSDNRLMAASVNGEGVAFEVGAVRPLFEVHPRTAEHRGQGPGSNYDVSADGQRFLVNTVAEQAAQAPITVVMNWTSALKK